MNAFNPDDSRIGRIMNFAKEVTMAISAVIKLNAVVVDSGLHKLADSDHIDQPVMKISRHTLAGHSLATGKTVFVKNAVTDILCSKCPSRSFCTDKAQIVVPIKVGHEMVGNFVLNAKTGEQRERLINNSDDYIEYLNKMSNLLANKIVSEEKTRQVQQLEEQLSGLINEVDNGLIYVSDKGKILYFNNLANTMFDESLSVGSKISNIIHESDWPVIQDTDFLIKRNSDALSVSVKVLKHSGALVTVQRTSDIQKKEHDIRRRLFKKAHIAKSRFGDIIGNDPAFVQTIKNARKYSSIDATVLINAETGTGKELFAQSIHNSSSRSKGPFVAINCAALPENLLESELFGYVKGAFTGASREGKAGLFEQAHGGTILLDEIGEMPLKLQSSLLRVLQQKEVMRIGDDRVIPVDVRIISATNKNLHELVAKEHFRKDLFYRLNILLLTIPPLRERSEDISLLSQYLLKNYCRNFGIPGIRLSKKCISILLSYDWPGNVRELENVMQRLVLLHDAESKPEQILETIIHTSQSSNSLGNFEFSLNLTGSFKDIQRQLISQLIEKTGDKTKTANLLGLSHMTLYRRMNEFNIN